MDKNTKHVKDRSTDTVGYLEYTKEKEKGKVKPFVVPANLSLSAL